MILQFENARLIDPEAGTDTIGSLSVEGGEIVARDAAAPKGAKLIDCGGQCLAPGMVERTRREMSQVPQVSVALGDAENPPSRAGGWDAAS